MQAHLTYVTYVQRAQGWAEFYVSLRGVFEEGCGYLGVWLLLALFLLK